MADRHRRRMTTQTLPRRPDTTTGPTPSSHKSWLRVWRGPATDPPWVRPSLLALLAFTALVYLWDLGASGWANSFYSAAAQAGSESWKAFFFGSSDAGNSITVDKPPLALWVMGASVRLFGLSSWSLLVPQALMGVGSVALLFATVRRTAGSAGAGLLAGAVLALTPVAALMFRFNNPDALLVLLLVGSMCAMLRAVESTSSGAADDRRVSAPVRWLILAGTLVGLAFLTKMLQAFLVLPGFAVVYMYAADTHAGRRVRHLAVALAAMLLSAGWWVAVVALWPAASRPYIGGTTHNSILELTFGYNGFGRITGSETGSVGGQNGWGATGWLRLLNSDIGGQIGWLLPTALVILIAALWFLRDRRRTDLTRAAMVAWGAWLVVTAVTFSFMHGIFHPYYTVALAPAIAAVVAIGSTTLWRRRDHQGAALVLAGATAGTSSLAFALLHRTPDYLPWLRWLILVVGLGAALVVGALPHLPRRVGQVAVAAALVAVLAGPAAYTASTVTTPHTGSIPSAGPATAGAGFAPRGLGQVGAMRGGPGRAGKAITAPPGGGVAAGGLLQGSTSTSAITSMLEADASRYTWVAAAVGSNTAAGYQLASQQPVMAIGGFNGSDPSPTLSEFKALVAAGRIHYFIGGSQGGGPMSASGGTSSRIARWVAASFTAKTVDGVTLYDLSGGLR
jgi:4-amino-4-deoxy-L-arabinose transferase-like glycosyltransferase